MDLKKIVNIKTLKNLIRMIINISKIDDIYYIEKIVRKQNINKKNSEKYFSDINI